MKVTKHTTEQIITKLREVERLQAQGKTIAQACKQIGVSEHTYYHWRKRYGAMPVDEAKRFKELERENQQLKKLVADLSLDNQMLKEVARETSKPGRATPAVTSYRKFAVSERLAGRASGKRSSQISSSGAISARVDETLARVSASIPHGYRRMTAAVAK